jgi:cytochrome c-type biogenesis protein CcmH
MLFWLVAAVLTAGVILWITRPLFRAPSVETGSAGADIAVYRDQLEEIDADLARGVLNEAEAEAARIEISRRLLHAAEASEAGEPAKTGIASRSGWTEPGKLAAVACMVMVPLTGLGLYLAVGAPGLPDQPRAARLAMPASELPVSELILRVEARLREHPEDARGWDVIAPIYLRQNRVREAEAAFERGIAVGGETAARLSGLAQAKVRLSRGRVTDEIMAINQKIVAMVPFAAEAEFWIALGLEQRGKLQEARAAFASLLKPETIGQPWRPAVQQRIAAIDQRLGKSPAGETATSTKSATAEPAPASAPGPSREQVEAAAKMTPDQRMAMIRGMVEGLEARLEENGDDIAGWQRLIRAHVVLGARDRAEAALVKAKAQFAENETALASLGTLSKALGLAGAETAQPPKAPERTEGTQQ